MKKKKYLIYSIPILIIGLVIGVIIYNVLTDSNRLTSEERNWINKNINNVQNIYVLKNENIFSKDGVGVFNSFLNDFSEEYGIKINIVTGEEVDKSYNNFNINSKLRDEDLLFYQDHFVVVSKNKEIINDIHTFDNKIIGVLNKDINVLKSHFNGFNVTLNGYDTIEDLYLALDSEVNYVMLSRMSNIDSILVRNLNIVYHFSDINTNYIFASSGDTLGSILKKYYSKWEEKITSKIKEEEFNIFKKSLNISDASIQELLGVDYKYGFVNNSPYEVIMNGRYGGITASYLQEFSEFSGVYFDITKYRNTGKLVKAINNGKVDLFFDYDGLIESDYKKTSNGIKNSLSIITNKDNTKVFNSIYGLVNETIYVINNSNIHKYLQTIEGVNIETVDTLDDLFKLNKSDKIIVMDTYIYDYYKNSSLNNYVDKYNTLISYESGFKIDSKYEVLYKLLNKYIEYLDNTEMIHKGINSHNEVVEKGNILNSIAKYIILIITLFVVVGFAVYRKSKRIRLSKKLKNTDKIRFVDDLTCLKNRSYLSDFMKTWNNNTVYPQAIIVMDLNNLKEINDLHGVDEGDKQIQAAANALIKTQLDNSELMRSDGNEFVIYTVSYNKKQIANYIHKLNRELKKMPYNYGAEFGISFIENNLKTIEDALTEATNDMKMKKDASNEKKNN